jgi:lipoprotein NlpD
VSAESDRFRLSACWAMSAAAGLLLALLLAGCGAGGPAPVYDGFGPAPDGYYRIRRGDTLVTIARRHKVDYETLARWNKLGPPYSIYAGKLLRVEPLAGETRKSGSSKSSESRTVKSTTRGGSSSKSTAKASVGASRRNKSSRATVASGLSWKWPLQGKVVQGFRGGDRTRQGIRIAGRAGQQVRAAESGTVVYSGSGLKGYGNLIIVKHNNSYLRAYGFNSRLLVKEGARVKRGQAVAEVGRASGGNYRLHFEIRRNGIAVDPLKYLP